MGIGKEMCCFKILLDLLPNNRTRRPLRRLFALLPAVKYRGSFFLSQFLLLIPLFLA